MGLRDLPPATARLECQHDVHTIVWRAGRLDLPDHPDPDAERALAGLGGTPCRCVEVLDLWSRHAADPRVLVVGPRGGEFTAAQDAARAASALELSDVVRLGASLPRRLVATVADALADRYGEPELGPALYAALYGRVLVALRRWLGELPELELEVIGTDEPPSLCRVPAGAGYRARLPIRWLVDVWGAELECFDGGFTLEVVRDPTVGRRLRQLDALGAVNTRTLLSG